MQAHEITFGVELETTMPSSDDTAIGQYHGGLQVPWLPSGWKVERDGSLRLAPNCKAAEFVSPKLIGTAGLQEVVNAVNAIEARGGKVNETCGLHISVTWSGDAHALARLITLFANHEKAFYASTGSTRRENAQVWSYSKPVKHYGDATAAKDRMSYDRCHAINLTHLACGRNRIEFRLFAGTLNADKVAGYVMMVLGIVELALATKRETDWNYAGTAKRYWDHDGAGVGETELARLFYRLNWNRGIYKRKHAFHDRVFGKLESFDMQPVMRKLTEMARKYDQQSLTPRQ